MKSTYIPEIGTLRINDLVIEIKAGDNIGRKIADAKKSNQSDQERLEKGNDASSSLGSSDRHDSSEER